MLKHLSEIARHLIKCDGGLVYATTEGEKWEKMPVELALLFSDDEMASLLIKSMLEKSR